MRLLGDMSQFLGTVGVASNRLFVCNETLANAKLVTVIRCADLFTGAAASNTLVVANLTLANGSAVRFGYTLTCPAARARSSRRAPR